MGFSNAYVVELEGQSLALVDTGTPGRDAKVLAYLTSMGRKATDFSYIILTHADGSISIYRPNEALFIGDLLRTDASGRLGLASARMSRDMDQVRRSI